MMFLERDAYIDGVVDLAGAFNVWAASPEAAFLNRRFVFAQWDVDALKAKEAEVAQNPTMFTMVLSEGA